MRANECSEVDLERLVALAQEQIDLARAATTREEKAAHLDLAAEYATARERAARVGWILDAAKGVAT